MGFIRKKYRQKHSFYKAYDKAVLNDASNLPARRTQQWAKMTQKNCQASQCKTKILFS